MRHIFLDTQNVRAGRSAMAVIEDVDKGNPGLATFYGRAGVGKTVFVKQYSVQTDAVYLRVMQDWTPRAMLGALSHEVCGAEHRTVDRCKRSICEALDHRPRTIIVDEADRLEVGMIEHFRDIHDLCGVPIVLVGEEHLFAQLSARRRLWSRVTQVVEFGPISVEDIMLYGLKAADLQVDGQAAAKIRTRTGGDFRLVHLDIGDLERMARAGGSSKVDGAMVSRLPARRARIAHVGRGRGGRNGTA